MLIRLPICKTAAEWIYIWSLPRSLREKWACRYAIVIKSGKNSILNNVSNNIEKELVNQEKNIEKLEKYIDMNRGFDKVRIQFDFNPMHSF